MVRVHIKALAYIWSYLLILCAKMYSAFGAVTCRFVLFLCGVSIVGFVGMQLSIPKPTQLAQPDGYVL